MKKIVRAIILCGILFFALQSVEGQTYIINTVAGNGTSGFSGDGSQAVLAQLNEPDGIDVDTAGNLYIADRNNNRIRKVNKITGIITTIAGNGTAGYAGDGGLATNAELNKPHGVTVDDSGNIYISDWFNYRIRKINVSTGIITTIAGNGTQGYTGDGGLAINATINESYGITVVAGNLYIASYGNNCIRKIDLSTGIITTIAGGNGAGFSGDGGIATSAQLNTPDDVAVDMLGNVYIASANNNRIRKVDYSTDIINTIAGNGVPSYSGDGGPATSAEVHWPNDVTVDNFGNVYIAAFGGNRVRKIDHSTGIINTIAGNGTAGYSGDGGPATLAELHGPKKLAVDDATGNIFIVDHFNHCVRELFASVVANFSSNDSSFCAGQCITFSDLSLGNPTNWSWFFPGGTPATYTGQNPPNICYNTPGSYSVELIVSDASDTDTLTVNNMITVNNCNLPNAAFTASDSILCDSDCITFTDNSTGSPTSWSWSFPGGTPAVFSGQNPPTICYDTTGTYDVTLIVSDGTTTDTLTKSSFITVNPLPNAGNLSGNQTICISDTTQISTSGDAGGTWSSGNTGIATVNNLGLVTAVSAGTTTIKYVASNSCGSDSATISITVKAGSNTTNVYKNCEGFSVTVNGNTYNSTGIYTDYVGCDTIITDLTIYPAPNGSACCPATIKSGDNAPLSVMPINSNYTYQWSPSSSLSCDTCTSTTASPTQSTWYTVIITDSIGCSLRDSVLITVTENCGAIYVPTAFSPNGDNFNDILKVFGNCIKSMGFAVYDRWGNKIFESSDPTKGWDGTYKGKAMNTGTYVYTLKTTDNKNKQTEKTGNVTLIR